MFNLALTYCLDNICTFLLFSKRSQVLLLHSRIVRLPVNVMQNGEIMKYSEHEGQDEVTVKDKITLSHGEGELPNGLCW